MVVYTETGPEEEEWADNEKSPEFHEINKGKVEETIKLLRKRDVTEKNKGLLFILRDSPF